MTDAEVVREAYSMIQAGWCRNAYSKDVNGKRHVCLVGAFRQIQMPSNQRMRVIDNLRRNLQKYEGNQTTRLLNWNDTRKSKQEVLSFLDYVLNERG